MSKESLNKTKTLFTPPELAKMLGVTRQEIIRRIWRGFIKAEKIGHQYIITKNEVKRVRKIK